MKIDITGAILLISAVNGLIFSFISFAKTREDRNNKYIAFLLLLCSCLIFDEFTRWTEDFFTQYPQFTYIFTITWFLIIPGIYLLVRNQLDYSGLKKMDVLHLIPLGVQLLNKSAYFSAPDIKKGILENYFRSHEPHDAKIIFGIQIIVYLILIYKALKKKYHYSGLEVFKKMSKWLKSIYVLLVFYLLAILAIIFFIEVLGYHLRWLDIGKTFVFVLIIYTWLLYFIYNPHALRYPVNSPKVWLDEYNIDNLSEKLQLQINQIKDSRIFLKPDVYLSEIAIELKTSARKLTESVNSELGINIPQLVNLLRIKEMEAIIDDPQNKHLTLIGVASKVGFKSKSSLYRSVKEFTGQSPSIYFSKNSLKNPKK